LSEKKTLGLGPTAALVSAGMRGNNATPDPVFWHLTWAYQAIRAAFADFPQGAAWNGLWGIVSTVLVATTKRNQLGYEHPT
jgi:hypothetical protein